MNRELFLNSLRKTKPVALLSIVLIAFAGIFIQHCFLSAEAAKGKWEFCERFDGDWYAYISNAQIRQVDPVQEELKELNGSTRMYTIDSYSVNGDYSAYQYSEEAWEFFSYALKEGDGFRAGDASQVIVSQGMSYQYPVGATIDLTFYSGPLEEEGTITCEVVGVLEAEEIIFPHNTTSGALLWNTDESFSEMTMQEKFVILNSELQLEQMKACVLSQGIFIDRDSLESEEWVERLMKNGTLISMKETYQNSEAERRVSMHDMAKGSILLLVAVISLLVWGYVIIRKCREDICYLLQIGFSRKKLYGCLVRMNSVLLIAAFLLSFVAYFLPNRYEDTWEMNAVAPIAAFAGYLFVWAVSSGMICLLFGNCTFETQKRIPCMEDMSLLDNIRLCLLVQGYSARAASKVAYTMLEERQIAFCAKRKMGNLAMEQQICFNEIVKESNFDQNDRG